jgi:DNA-binding response OmpR family regulator
MGDDSGNGAILGRITAPPEVRRAPASSVDVLLVHGDDAFSHRIAGLLRRNGYTVVDAPGAASAREAVRAGCVPRLVLLELEGVSGPERAAIAGLQAEPPCDAVPFLVLTRSGSGAVPGLVPAATLMVPIEAAELVEAVRRFCGTLAG